MKEHIIINCDRVVTVPQSLRKIGVQYDHNVNTLTFDCPRYWDDVDLLTMKIYINYKLSDKTPGSYLAKNVRVSETDENMIHFDWRITRKVTKLSGSLTCLVCAKLTNEEGIEENHWNSDIFSTLLVTGGMENEEVIEEENTDLITQLLLSIDTTNHSVDELATAMNEVKNDTDEATVVVSQLQDHVTAIAGAYAITWNEGGYISRQDGTVNAKEGSSYSDFIEVEPCSRLIITNTMTTDNEFNAFYDASETFLSSFSNATGALDVPSGAYKMRLSKYSSATIMIAADLQSEIDAAEAEIEELKSDLSSIHNGKNLCGRDNKIYYPVDLKTGDVITMSTKDGSYISYDDGQPLLCFYDENKNLLSRKSFLQTTNYRTIVLTSECDGTKYITWEETYPKELQVEKGDKTSYEPYNNGVVEVIDQSLEAKINKSIDIPKEGVTADKLSRLFVGGLQGVCNSLINMHRVATRDIVYFPFDVTCEIDSEFQAGFIECSDKYGSNHKWSGWKTGNVELGKGYYLFQWCKLDANGDEIANIGIWNSKIKFYKKDLIFEYKSEGIYLNTKVNRYNVALMPYTLPNPSQAGGNSLQGIAYSNGVIFQLYDDNRISLIEYASGTVINNLSIKSDHGDTIDFTNDYYNSDDEFPLCHITSDSNPAKVYVVRITRSETQLIKTLSFPIDETGYYAGHVTDSLNNIIYQLGYKNKDYLTSNNGNKTVLSAWDISNLIDNGDGTFSPTLIYKKEIPFIFVMQGQCFFDNRLCIVSSANHTYGINTKIYFINPCTGLIEKVIDKLPSDMLTNEIEGISFVDIDNKYCAILSQQNTGKLYRIEFE